MDTKTEYVAGDEVDTYKLARLMLRWRAQKQKLDTTEEQIKALVLKARKTQTAGDVRATYCKPRNSYDYETPVVERLDDPEVDYDERVQLKATVTFHSKTVVDWRAACQTAGIDPIVTPGKGPGTVSIKTIK